MLLQLVLLNCRKINMERMKQPRIIVYFNKKNRSKISETGSCQNGKEASIKRSIASVEHTYYKKNIIEKLNLTEKIETKGEFVRQ